MRKLSKRDAKCDSKEINEIVRQEMDALHTCRPNDDESRNLLTTQNSGIVGWNGNREGSQPYLRRVPLIEKTQEIIDQSA